MSTSKGPTTPFRRQQLLKRAERDKQLLALVRAGATMPQIAETMGYSDASYASKAWRDAMLRAGPTEGDKKFARARHRDRLEAMWRIAWSRIAPGDGKPVDPKWFENGRKLLADLCEFEGTSAPKEVRLGGSTKAGPIHFAAVDYGDLTEMNDEQLAEVRRALTEAAKSVATATEVVGNRLGDGEPEEDEGEPG